MQSNLHGCPRFSRLAGLFVLLALACLPAAAPRHAAAQDDTPPGYRSYKLEHAPAVEFGGQLRKVLQKAPGKPDVMVDKQQNRVLVQGTEEAHRLTAQLVKALDRPANGAAEEGEKNRRIPRAEGGRHKLTHVTWREFEDTLKHVWGSRLALTTSRTGELATVQLPGPPEAAAVMQIDRARGEISLAGPPSVIAPWEQVVRAIDSKRKFAGEQTELVPIRHTDPSQVQQAVTMVRAAMHGAIGDTTATVQLGRGGVKRKLGGDLISMIFQPRRPPGEQPEEEQPEEEMQPPRPIIDDPREGGLLGPVSIEFIEGLDTLVIRGNKRDVDKVLKIIEDIEKESEKTKPVIEVYNLRHTTSQTIADIVLQLYDQVLSARQGRVSITPLVKPNALLLIGREESVKAVIDLIERLDRPLPREAQFQVFQLKHINAAQAQTVLDSLFPTGQPGLSERVLIVSEPRSNALIVQGGPRDLAEVRRVIDKIDVNTGAKKLEMRVFKLKNSLAQELAPLLQNSILGRLQQGAGGQGQNLQQQIPQATNPAVQPGQPGGQQPSAPSIQFIEVDPENNKIINSAIMADVIISADTRNNSLLVRAPPESMELIAALIRQLDSLPVAEAQIKVFTIVNADATNLATMLQNLFGTGQGQQGFQQNQTALQSPTGSGESLLVSLRFAVDLRTNSIIASGTAGDLQVVEAILLRLDEGDLQTRKTTVYRLNNAPAVDVAASINQMLTNRRTQVYQPAPNLISQFERVEREVIVVPEVVSNSLIVSATPKYFGEIAEVVKQLDSRPPMVMIQVVIAEVTLNDQKELGIEVGLQDSLLFNRGLAAGPAAAPVVGFPFNQANLGNDLTAGSASLAQRALLLPQGLSSLGVGRTNPTLGYAGLVVSAGNDSINILMRALHDQQRLQVLARPQIMTLNNQPAYVQVGQQVPYIQASTLSVNGTQNSTTLIPVGIILGVTPRTSPDGLVVMELDAEKSAVGAEADGIPISINAAGSVIRSPKIDVTKATTTVSAKSGQTVIFAGLITKNKTNITRRTPYLSDIPILGNLFRFDIDTMRRTELVIIMTPYVVRNDEDADWVKRMEADRMSWCLSDVIEIHQEGKGLSGNRGPWGSESTPMIYPDGDPSGMEPVPANPNSARPIQPEQRPELMPPDRSGTSRRNKSASVGDQNSEPATLEAEPPPASFRNAKQPTPAVPTATDTTTKVWLGPPPASARKFATPVQARPISDPRAVAPANYEEPGPVRQRESTSAYRQPARFPEVK